MEQWTYLLRMLFAAACGFIIGFERKLRLKEAGVRTHTLVSLGACLIMEVSKYGFSDIDSYDASRVAAQIVSGIGFLGAGMILYKREALRGLTTAAGIWTTAGVGMCAGAGLYILTVGATAIIVLVQLLLHLPVRFFSGKPRQVISLEFEAAEGRTEEIMKLFEVKKFLKMRTFRDGDGFGCSATLRTFRLFSEEEICAVIRDYPYIKTVERLDEMD